MRFTSRSGTEASFREALFTGLAPDGGLYLPVEKPDLSRLIAGFDDAMSFIDVSAEVAAALFAPEIDAPEARDIAARAFPFSPELRRLDDRILLLELFHGPSCAFKDFAAQFLAVCMEHFLKEEDRRIRIIVATSGDTGSAVAQAFHGKRNIDVVILYPSGRVTDLQEKQLTTLGGNVHALEIMGSFDDCQSLAKRAFRDQKLRSTLNLTSANSINIGRLLPQCFSYIYALTRRKLLGLPPGKPGAPSPEDGRPTTTICVPSGNFGNLTAGVYAWHWGLPVSSFIAATNINDIVPQYLASGIYTPRASHKTLSNAMDVGNPSNFERLLSIFGGDWQAMRSMIRGIAVTDEDTRQSMREVFNKYGVFVDPHTAVGYKAACEYLAGSGSSVARGGSGSAARDGQVIVLSTAHPAKFLDIVRDSVGSEPPVPERLARCLTLPKKSTTIGASFGELTRFLTERFA